LDSSIWRTSLPCSTIGRKISLLAFDSEAAHGVVCWKSSEVVSDINDNNLIDCQKLIWEDDDEDMNDMQKPKSRKRSCIIMEDDEESKKQQ